MIATSTMVPTMCRLVERHIEVEADPAAGIDQVVTVWLEGVDGPLGPFAPGQFAMLWAPGVGEVPLSVSMTGAGDGSDTPGRLGFTIRAVGSTTEWLCGAEPGASVGVRGPFGRGWSVPGPGSRHVVVAGGIGLAPLRLLIDRLAGPAAEVDGPGGLVVVIGARTPAEILWSDDIDRWRDHAEVHVTVDRPAPGWTGEVGLVTSTLSRLDVGAHTSASLCGPEIMMRLAGGDLVSAGADPSAVEVSMERSMACAVAHCGRCQIGPVLVCRDGPVFAWRDAHPLMEVRRW